MLPTKRIYVFFLTFYSKKNNNTRNKLYTNKLLIDFFLKKNTGFRNYVVPKSGIFKI